MSFTIGSVSPHADNADSAPRGMVASLLGAFSRWRSRSRAMSELLTLSDRELLDIGLTRGSIPYAVYGYRNNTGF